MAPDPEFDLQSAHRYFAASCFNTAWDFIERPTRTPDDDEEMIALAIVSVWHWSKVDGHTPTHLATGYWQVARAYALAGQPNRARRAAESSLRYSRDCSPFYTGYAYEALARAELVAGNLPLAVEYLRSAHSYAELISNPDERSLLVEDLHSLDLKLEDTD